MIQLFQAASELRQQVSSEVAIGQASELKASELRAHRNESSQKW